MRLSEELVWRGFVAEHTFDRVEDLDEGTRKFYWGTDPSADSLHVGHLAALMMCACFIRHGCEPTLLVGGATGQVGDPKEDAERELKGVEEIERNKAALAAQIQRVVRVEGLRMVDNWDWFQNINYIRFLNQIGKHFSLTQMLDRKFVKDRTGEGGSGISLAEFAYTTIQGYDFLHLYREYGVDLQLCGADQFGNCVSGMQLIRKLEGGEADVWSCPLIIDKVTGRKFGKSEGNAVWLDEGKTSVFDFYQFWLNQSDDAVEDYLKIYTLMQPDELTELMAEHLEKPEARAAQRRLAFEATMVVHGEDEARMVERVTEVLYGQRDAGDLNIAEVEGVLEKAIPVVGGGRDLVSVVVEGGLAGSKGEARKLIEGGGIAVWMYEGHFSKVTDPSFVVGRGIVRKGKNKFVLAKVSAGAGDEKK